MKLTAPSPNRRIKVALVCYLAVVIFVLAFFSAAHAKDWLQLPTPLSETGVFAFATLFAAPVLLPFIWERLTKFKFGPLELELQAATAGRVTVASPDELALVVEEVELSLEPVGARGVKDVPIETSEITDISKNLAPTIIYETRAIASKEAGTGIVVEVNLGDGKAWWTTRLYLLAALAEDYTTIRQMVFLENHQGQERMFLGSASPRVVRQFLAADNPILKEAYQDAVKMSDSNQDMGAQESRVVRIAANFVMKLNERGGEVNLKEFARQFLDQHPEILGHGIEWNGGSPTLLLVHDIMNRDELLVPLVKSNGQFSLVIDRLKLAEQIAKAYLRQQLE